MKLSLTVAICTWNRSKLLHETLTRLVEIKDTCDDWELIVIDNNSTDDTQEVLKNFLGKLPLRILIEKRQGLSHARNLALQECQSDLLVFTDDDVLVGSDWIRAYRNVVDRFGNDIAFFGGAVYPWFEVEPSPSLVEAIPTVGMGFCGVELPELLDISHDAAILPVGANFAFRKSLIGNRVFRTDLGLAGGARIAGEETEFLRGLLDEGKKGVWIQNAEVKHWVPQFRISKNYLKRHLFDLGRTSARVRKEEIIGSKWKTVTPRWMFKEFFVRGVRYLTNYFVKDSVGKWRNFSRFFILFGFLYEVISIRRTR
ncbi:MAG: glycosyltransferase [Pirellula sp.]